MVAVAAVATAVAVLRLQGLWAAGGVDPTSRSAGDPLRPRTGAVAVYAIFALSATARAAVQIATKFSQAPLAYLLSALAGVVYIVATVALARGLRRLAWAAVGFELLGVLVVGTLTVLVARDFPDDTVWSVYGRGYGFVPLVLPFVGLWWLWHTRPR